MYISKHENIQIKSSVFTIYSVSKLLLTEMIEKNKIGSLLTANQLNKSEHEEIYLVRVPVRLKDSTLPHINLNLKSPDRITLQDKVFSPVLDKDVETKTMVVSNKSQEFGQQCVMLKGIITLRESVVVPSIPKLEIPPDSRVAPPPPLVTRHPIYGRSAVLKRNIDEVEVKVEEDQLEDSAPPKKKKKKKDKNKSKAD